MQLIYINELFSNDMLMEYKRAHFTTPCYVVGIYCKFYRDTLLEVTGLFIARVKGKENNRLKMKYQTWMKQDYSTMSGR